MTSLLFLESLQCLLGLCLSVFRTFRSCLLSFLSIFLCLPFTAALLVAAQFLPFVFCLRNIYSCLGSWVLCFCQLSLASVWSRASASLPSVQGLDETAGSPFSRSFLHNLRVYWMPALPLRCCGRCRDECRGPQGELWWRPGQCLSVCMAPFAIVFFCHLQFPGFFCELKPHSTFACLLSPPLFRALLRSLATFCLPSCLPHPLSLVICFIPAQLASTCSVFFVALSVYFFTVASVPCVLVLYVGFTVA